TGQAIMQDTRLEDAGIADRLSRSELHRRTMVDCQIRTFDVTDQPLLARMLEVPREHFLPGELAQLAYSDIGLQLKPAGPGGERRTLLPPLVLARLIQGAGVVSTGTVLDVGAATGYSSALLADLAGRVVAVQSRRLWLGEGSNHHGPACGRRAQGSAIRPDFHQWRRRGQSRGAFCA